MIGIEGRCRGEQKMLLVARGASGIDARDFCSYSLASSFVGTRGLVIVRNFIFWLSTKRGVTNRIARHGMKNGFARRFVAGETLEEALTASEQLCSQGRNVSLNHLGENVSTEAAAREVCAGYI